jgi:hypothetical protein
MDGWLGSLVGREDDWVTGRKGWLARKDGWVGGLLGGRIAGWERSFGEKMAGT